MKSLRRWQSRHALRDQIRAQGFPPVLWSKGYAAWAEQNGGLTEALGRTERRWTLAHFLRLYDEKAFSYWIPLTSNRNPERTVPLDWFADHILPKIKHPFVLITTDGDAQIPGSFKEATIQRILGSEYLDVWYSQNLTDIDYGQKLRGLPIGLDLHSERSGKVGWDLFNSLQEIALGESNNEDIAIVDFCFNRNSKSRQYLCEGIEDQNDISVLSEPLDQLDLWRLYSRARFVISPEGVGPDCHRTWEALYLGATVICKELGLGHLYENLSVYQVSSWGEIFEQGFFDKVRLSLPKQSSLWDISYRTWLADLKHAAEGGLSGW